MSCALIACGAFVSTPSYFVPFWYMKPPMRRWFAFCRLFVVSRFQVAYSASASSRFSSIRSPCSVVNFSVFLSLIHWFTSYFFIRSLSFPLAFFIVNAHLFWSSLRSPTMSLTRPPTLSP